MHAPVYPILPSPSLPVKLPPMSPVSTELPHLPSSPPPKTEHSSTTSTLMVTASKELDQQVETSVLPRIVVQRARVISVRIVQPWTGDKHTVWTSDLNNSEVVGISSHNCIIAIYHICTETITNIITMRLCKHTLLAMFASTPTTCQELSVLSKREILYTPALYNTPPSEV